MSHARSTRTRTKVQCFCTKCNGALVDPRTKKGHMSKRINYQEAEPSELPDEMDDVEMDDNETGDNAMEYDLLPERNYIFLTKRLPINESEKSQFVKKGKISDRVLDNLLSDDHSSEDSDNDDQDINFEDSEDSEDEDYENDEYEEVNFVSPDFEDDEPKLPSININHAYAWIILWILQYQQRYKLSRQ